MSKAISYQPAGAYVTLQDLLLLRSIAVQDMRELPSRFSFIGETEARDIGQGMEYAGVRVYGFGDDARRIDWRVTARKQETHIKVFHEQFDSPVYLFVDQSSSLFFGSRKSFKSVTVACLAAWFYWKAHFVGHPVGSSLCNHERFISLRPNNQEKHILTMCQQLIVLNNYLNKESVTTCGSKLEQALVSFSPQAARYSRIFLISDFLTWGDDMERLLAKIARSTKVRLCLVYDEMEKNLPKNGLLRVAGGGTSALLDTSIGTTKRTWDNIFKARIERMTDFCKERSIQLQMFSTEDIIGA